MYNGNRAKADLLGEPFGTANNKLKKLLLFTFAWQLDLRDCYRCGKPIDDIKEFSIEHKHSWMSAIDPKQAFYDLSNIAFSHIKCNTSAIVPTNKKYDSEEERNRAQFKRYYDRNSEDFLKKKRERYHNNKKQEN